MEISRIISRDGRRKISTHRIWSCFSNFQKTSQTFQIDKNKNNFLIDCKVNQAMRQSYTAAFYLLIIREVKIN
jgi:hypothetical protein